MMTKECKILKKKEKAEANDDLATKSPTLLILSPLVHLQFIFVKHACNKFGTVFIFKRRINSQDTTDIAAMAIPIERRRRSSRTCDDHGKLTCINSFCDLLGCR